MPERQKFSDIEPKAGGIVINPRGEILVITNDIGKRTLPKGSPNGSEEKPIETAAREMCEEGGLEHVDIVRYLGVLARPGYAKGEHDFPSVLKLILMFQGQADQAELHPVAPDSQHAEWVEPDRLATILSWPEEVAFVEMHRARLLAPQVIDPASLAA